MGAWCVSVHHTLLERPRRGLEIDAPERPPRRLLQPDAQYITGLPGSGRGRRPAAGSLSQISASMGTCAPRLG